MGNIETGNIQLNLKPNTMTFINKMRLKLPSGKCRIVCGVLNAQTDIDKFMSP